MGGKTYRKEIAYQLFRDDARGLCRLSFRALGTQCGVLFAASGAEEVRSFAEEAVEWLGCFEGKYSRFLDTSLISEINRQAGKGWVGIDAEMESLLALCDDLHFVTRGLLDPTAMPLIRLWDFRRKRASLPSTSEVRAARDLVGWAKVQRRSGEIFLPKEGMALDFGGFGKEYAVDKVAALAAGRGIESCLVDFGQDIRVIGVPPDAPAWHIGLEDPLNPGTTWTGLALLDERGVATSGDYLRNFEHEGKRYGHIIDPRTGYPVANGAHAVTVIAPSCLEAGALSTSAFTAGPDDGLAMIEANFDTEGCFVSKNSILQTSRFYEYIVQV